MPHRSCVAVCASVLGAKCRDHPAERLSTVLLLAGGGVPACIGLVHASLKTMRGRADFE